MCVFVLDPGPLSECGRGSRGWGGGGGRSGVSVRRGSWGTEGGGAWSLSEWVLMGVLDPWVLSVGVRGL